MSVLTKKEILEYINHGELSFNPPVDQFQIQPHAIDLRLGFTFFIPNQWEINEKGRCALNIDYLQDIPKVFEEVKLKEGQFFEILPQETIIAQTLELINIKSGKLMAIIYPRSSLNRRGLAVDLTGVVDTKYSGYLIIPVKNNTNQIIKLYPGERICSIVFETLVSEISDQEARRHGVNMPKYSHNGIANYKQDKSENDFIRQGDINGLKNKFPIKYS